MPTSRSIRRIGQLEETLVRSPAQVHTAPTAHLHVVLNTRVPPFDNVDVRRAINFAVDRDRVAQILGGGVAVRPTCQRLPPNFPGYEPYCRTRLTWSGEGRGSARTSRKRSDSSVSGTAGMNIVIELGRIYRRPQRT